MFPGAKPLEEQSLGPGPSKASLMGNGLDDKFSRIKKSSLEYTSGALPMGHNP
jgi:hypothetical protein